MFPHNPYLIIFKKVVTISLLDHLLTELNVRFDKCFYYGVWWVANNSCKNIFTIS